MESPAAASRPRRVLLLCAMSALFALSASAAPWSVTTLQINSGSEPGLMYPLDVAAGIDGSLYIADTGNHAIRRISTTGQLTTIAGMPGTPGSDDGVGSAARFNYPAAITVDLDGTIYVADTYNFTIRRISTDGRVTTLAGLAGQSGLVDAAGSFARFGYVHGLAIDAAGNVWVADTSNDAIRTVSRDGRVTTFAGNGAAGAGDGFRTDALFWAPRGIAIDSSGVVWVADSSNHTIRRIGLDGFVTTPYGQANSRGNNDGIGSEASFTRPAGITIAQDGRMFVTDPDAHVLREIDPTGMVSTIAGTAGVRGGTDGMGSQALLDTPFGIAVDSGGTLFTVDYLQGTVRVAKESSITTTSGLRRRGIRR